MASVEVDGYLIEKLISEHEIQVIVQELAERIYTDYQGRVPVLVGVLKGANPFMADLMRELGRGNPETGRPIMPVEIDFIQVHSYDGQVSSGEISQSFDLSTSIKGRDVILIEDILDTGRTLTSLMDRLAERKPNSISICVFLDKPDRRKVSVEAKYCGQQIPDKFVVGYGLDWKQKFRYLPFIGVVGQAVASQISTPPLLLS